MPGLAGLGRAGAASRRTSTQQLYHSHVNIRAEGTGLPHSTPTPPRTRQVGQSSLSPPPAQPVPGGGYFFSLGAGQSYSQWDCARLTGTKATLPPCPPLPPPLLLRRLWTAQYFILQIPHVHIFPLQHFNNQLLFLIVVCYHQEMQNVEFRSCF